VMDWGIAKPMAAARAARAAEEVALAAHPEEAPSSNPPAPPASGPQPRLLATRIGAFVGTPSYMAPEQALGRNDELDARSDLYSAAVLLHELVTLRHYLGEQPSVEALLAAVVAGPEVSPRTLLEDLHPEQSRPPAELMYTLARGLRRDPTERFQTAAEMIEELQSVLEGRGAVRCQVTFTKRMLREMGRFVDRHPLPAMLTMLAVMASVVFTGAALLRTMLA
jgi:serine/threonine protein kinase